MTTSSLVFDPFSEDYFNDPYKTYGDYATRRKGSMVTRAIGRSGQGVEDAVPAPHSCADGDARFKYRIDVVGFNAADVVWSAGGWLYDRAMAGWEVNVLLPEVRDIRPLQILGVRTRDVDSELPTIGRGVRNHGLAVSAEVFECDARVRATVLEALGPGLTEVTLWGDGWPAEVQREVGIVEYRLGAAARAFKSQALAAAEMTHRSVGLTETFFADKRSCSSVNSGLISVG